MIHNLKKRLPALLLGSALGLGGGWLARGFKSPSPATEVTPPVSSPDGQTRPAAHAPATQKVAAGDAASIQSFLRLACAADTAPLSEMPGHLLKTQPMPAVLPFLAAHWAQRDAAHMFATLSKDQEARALAADSAVRKALFDHWLKADKDAALAALGDPKALPDMDGLRSAAVGDLLYKDPHRALALIGEWKLNLHYNDMRGISEWAKREPAAAADAAAQVPLPMVCEHLILEIAHVWKGTDPASAIQWAAGHARKFPTSPAAAALVGVFQLHMEDGSVPAKAKAAADAITDPALRLRLGLPLAPAADRRAVAPMR